MSQSAQDFEVKLAISLLENQPYAIDIMKIKQIIRPMKITKLPKAPDFLEGVINLRGVVIPVIDMRKRFSLPPRGEGEETKVIIASVDRRIVGIIVDEVTEVIPVQRSEIQPPPRVVKGVEATYLLGVCRYQDDILLILNLDEILTAEEKITLSTLKENGSRKKKLKVKGEN
jgi:purine-binding chemotaxis protein CheW